MPVSVSCAAALCILGPARARPSAPCLPAQASSRPCAPQLGYTAGGGTLPAMPTFATQRQLENHKREQLLFEVEVLRVGDARRQ